MGNNVNHDDDGDDDAVHSDAVPHTYITSTSFSHATARPFVH